MNAKQKRILKYVGYAAFYLFALMFCAFLTFPFDRLRTRIQSEFNASQTGPNPLTLRLGHLSSYWFSGIRADDVDLTSPPSTIPPEDPSKPNKPKLMRIDTVHVRVSLLRLLFGTMHVNFGAQAFGGDAWAALETEPSAEPTTSANTRTTMSRFNGETITPDCASVLYA